MTHPHRNRFTGAILDPLALLRPSSLEVEARFHKREAMVQMMHPRPRVLPMGPRDPLDQDDDRPARDMALVIEQEGEDI